MTNDTKAFVIDVLIAEALEHQGILNAQYLEDPGSVFVYDECKTLAKLYSAAAELIMDAGKPHA